MPRTLGDDEVAALLEQARWFRSTATVHAVRLTDEHRWTTAAGDELVGAAGDWLLSEGDDTWTVAADVFAATYEPVADGIYRKVALVQAAQLAEDVEVITLEGIATAGPGDWLARNPGGDVWPIPAEVFADRYVGA